VRHRAATPARRAAWLGALAALAALTAGCSQVGGGATVPPSAATPAAAAPRTAATLPVPASPSGQPSAARAPGPMARARSWDEFRLLAAQRIVAVNPQLVYGGPVPEPLLAIPVLEIELNADGTVRRIGGLRHPTQARDTVQLAIDAVQRAAPFSGVAHLPRPWKFTEVFLFDDDRRFKPRSLDL
jgi:hypothetical protein